MVRLDWTYCAIVRKLCLSFREYKKCKGLEAFGALDGKDKVHFFMQRQEVSRNI